MAQPAGIGKMQVRDWIRGLFLTILTAVVAVIKTSIDAGDLVFNWKAIATAAVGAIVAYISMNLLTNNKGQLLTPDQPKP